MRRREFAQMLPFLLWGCAHGTSTFEPSGKVAYLVQPFFDTVKNKSGILIINLSTGASCSAETLFDVHQVTYDSVKKKFIGANKYGKQFLTFTDVTISDIKYFNIEGSGFSLSGHIVASSSSAINDYFFSGVEDSTGKNSIIKINKDDHSVSAHAIFEKTFPPVHDMKFVPGSDIILATAGKKLHYFDVTQKSYHVEKLADVGFESSSVRHFEIYQDLIALQSNVIADDYKYSNAEIVISSKNAFTRRNVGAYFSELRDNEIHDLAISRDFRYIGAAHGGASSLTMIELNTGKYFQINFNERIYRVCQWPNAADFLVVGKKNLYRLKTSTLKADTVRIDKNTLSDDYYYNHRTIVEV